MLEKSIMQMQEWGAEVFWWYGRDKTDSLFRLVSVNDLLSTYPTITLSEWTGLDLSRAAPERPRYAAISHVWEPSKVVKEISAAASRPLYIMIGVGKIHSVSWHGLCQAAEAAKKLGCEYIWLDLLCINQMSDDDKEDQIKNMGNIYEKAAAVIVMPGGVAAAQPPQTWTAWITRAWTLQEAILCRNTHVLIVHAAPEFKHHVDDNLAIYPLETLVRKATEVSKEVPFDVGCFGNDSNVRSLRALLEARDNRAMRMSAAWRCIWLRRSKKEQDMVFSIMHLFEVPMKVDYGKSRDYLIRELAWGVSKLPSFLDIGALPFWDDYGLLPQLPSFTAHGEPIVKVGSSSVEAHEFIYGSTYISKFDLKMLTSTYLFNHGDMVCARIFEIQRRKSGRPCKPYISCHGETHELERHELERHKSTEVYGTHAVLLGDEVYYPYSSNANKKFIGPTVFFIEKSKSESSKWLKLEGRAHIPRSFLRKERSHVKVGGYWQGGIEPCICDKPEMWASPSGQGGNMGPTVPITLGANVSNPFGRWFG